MEDVCPVCNKLKEINFYCEKCKGKMKNKGRVEEYMDPYGSEMPIKDSKEYCLHLFSCEKCSYTQNVYIRKINV